MSEHGIISKQLYSEIIKMDKSSSNTVPETLKSVLSEIVNLLKKHPCAEKFYSQSCKALFFGEGAS
jgi:hypothetical protein